MSEVVDLAEYAKVQARYARACCDAVDELTRFSGELLATALGFEELRKGGESEVGTVVLDAHQVLAQSPDWRVQKLVELSVTLAEAARAIGGSSG